MKNESLEFDSCITETDIRDMKSAGSEIGDSLQSQCILTFIFIASFI